MAVPEHASTDARGRRTGRATPERLRTTAATPSTAPGWARHRRSSASTPLPLSREERTAITPVINDFRPPTARGTDDGSDGEVQVVATPPSAAIAFETRRYGR